MLVILAVLTNVAGMNLKLLQEQIVSPLAG